MAATPLLRTPQIQGGSFYAFSSAARDLSKTFNNSNLRLVFSKFAALNIPDIASLDFNTFSQYQNYVQLDSIDGAINAQSSGDVNIDFAESLQNYTMNLETLILNDDDYDSTVNKSISERAFFKWLKEVGGIRFEEAISGTEVTGTLAEKRFREEDEKTTGTERYQKVVQYVGDIDIVNNVDKAGETYTEVWLHIPTEVGNTPIVLFESLEDANYRSNLVITGQNEFIYGRDTSTIHPEGLRINAFYDYDDPISYTDPNANWANQSSTGGFTNSYFTESVFDDATNTDIKKYPADYGLTGTGVAYRRSSLDGIGIDFNSENYAQIVNDPAISTMQQYNGADSAGNFEFNAVLVYYDLFDVNDPTNKVTNLYGVLLLDNVTPTSDGGYFSRLSKFRPNAVTKQNGNSWGMILNLKFDASVATAGVDSIINEYNTFSMGLFADTMAQLQESVRLFTQVRSSVNTFESRVTDLENSISSVDSTQNLNDRMTALEAQLSNAQLAFDQSTTLLDLIASNSDAIQEIINGNTTLELQYNTEVIKSGSGILVDRSVPNKLKITQKTQEYELSAPYDRNNLAISSTNELDLNSSDIQVNFELREFTNMCRLYSKNTALTDIKFNIDDSSTLFKKGQTIRIVFNDVLDIGSRNILFYTDKDNRFGQGSLGYIIAQIDDTELLSNKPIIELICIDPDNYTFAYDILR